MSQPKYPEWIVSKSDKLMYHSFLMFLFYVWTQHLDLPRPTRMQKDIAEYLQSGPKRRMIQAFRGIGKSWITCAYVCWRLWRNPQVRCLIVSANEKKALENATFIKQLIQTVPVLSPLRGGARDSALSFDVGPASPNPSPSVRCDGIFGQITGARADILLADDVEVPKNSETETMREKLEDRTKEFSAVKTRNKKEPAEIIWLGTPQTEESIYRALPERGYEVRIWPARYPTPEKMPHYGDRLSPLLLEDLERDPELGKASTTQIGGAPTDPERFDDIDLMETEADYRAAGFALQFMLDTRLSDAERYPLKLRDLIVAEWDTRKEAPVSLTWAAGPQTVIQDLPNVGFDGDRYHRPMKTSEGWEEYHGAVMHIDPSGRGKDETAYVVTKAYNGYVYLVRAGGLKGGYETETLEALAHIAREEQVNKVMVEGNFGDGMYLELLEPVLKRLYPVSTEEYYVTGQKEARMLDKLEPVIQGHRLVVDRRVIEKDYSDTEKREYRLFYQMTHLTRDRGALKHDDRLDALAEAVFYWIDHMDRDLYANEDEFKRREFEKELEKFELAVKKQSRPKRLKWAEI